MKPRTLIIIAGKPIMVVEHLLVGEMMRNRFPIHRVIFLLLVIAVRTTALATASQCCLSSESGSHASRCCGKCRVVKVMACSCCSKAENQSAKCRCSRSSSPPARPSGQQETKFRSVRLFVAPGSDYVSSTSKPECPAIAESLNIPPFPRPSLRILLCSWLT